jgi:CubicO group peptidase (beta-lactamase class C family)
LEDLLRGWERDRDLACSVLLTCGGEVAFEGCFGPADRGDCRPITPATRFGLASVTKMFTAVAVADLVAAGALRFHDRVADLLPAEMRPATLRGDVTVHHLLCHTSGIADYFEEEEDHPAAQQDYGALWRDHPSYRMLRPADFLPLFGDLPPYRAPGERYQYSNAGYIVLGLIIEAVADRPYTAVVEDRVLARVGIDRQRLPPPGRGTPRRRHRLPATSLP